VASVLLGIDDPGSGRELGTALTAAGHAVTWVGALEVTPRAAQPTPEIVIVDGDAPGMDLGLLAASWRRREPAPALLVLSATGAGRVAAARVRAQILPKPAQPAELVAETARLCAPPAEHGLTPQAALAALGLPGGGPPEDEAALIVNGARALDIDVVREALRPHMHAYATATARVDRLCARRALSVSEARLAVRLDGGRTVRGAIDGFGRTTDSSPEAIPAHTAARLLWGLVSGGAVVLSREPPAAHPTARLRAHLRARARLAGAGHYPVLEVGFDAMSIDIERATMLLELRYGPDAVARHDLGDAVGLAETSWEQIQMARQVLGDPRLRASYDATLVRSGPELEESRLRRRMYADEAERSFVRGQHALASGNVFRAVSELAAAARRMPDQPDYEVYAAWARFLADETRGLGGAERIARAQRERSAGEKALLGRRPWPRALFVLGLLCEATGDGAGAIGYFREALVCDDKLVAARQALARLGATM
jgi:CheY-like chemotaxis protein